MSSKDSDRISAAQQTLDSKCQPCSIIKILTTTALFDISQLLNTQLDKETLATCVGMIESGVNPEALAVRTDTRFVLSSSSNQRLLSKNCVAKQLH